MYAADNRPFVGAMKSARTDGWMRILLWLALVIAPSACVGVRVSDPANLTDGGAQSEASGSGAADNRKSEVSFISAGAMSRAPDGTVYVIERARSSIVRVSPNGGFMAEYGGPGTSEGELLEPTDIDASSGLFFAVSDAGNGNVVRFTREGAFVESLVIPSVRGGENPRPILSSFRLDSGGSPFRETEPLRVVETGHNELIVLDGISNSLVKTDRLHESVRSLERVGTSEDGASDPVAIATYGDFVLVADRTDSKMHKIDTFGASIESWTMETSDLNSIRVFENHVWLGYSDKLVQMDFSGGIRQIYRLTSQSDVIDFELTSAGVWLLSESRLRFLEEAQLRQLSLEN